MRGEYRAWGFVLCALAMGLVARISHGQEVAPVATGEYVDSAECAQCHADIARNYAKTGMARSFYAPDASSFPDPQPYFHQASSTWYQIVARDGAWFQRWWQIGPKGQEESAGEAKIDYVMGSGNHVRTYLHRTPRGALTMLPLAWYSEKGGTWALNPGFDFPDPPVGRKAGYECMFCHNSYPDLKTGVPVGHEAVGAEPIYTGALPQGIDCQRCHGPGGDHVRTVRQAGAKLEDVRRAILNPARMPKQQSMEVCMQCHLETTSWPLPGVIRRYDRTPFSYRPGEPLSSYQLTFDHAPGAGREAKFEIVNSVYRLQQSKCFLESKGELGCTTCHNPHDIQHGAASTAAYNQKCVGCHAATKIAAKDHPAANSDCVSCHMPKRRTEDVIHVVMTDHLIQRRAPANALAEFPEKFGDEVEYRGEVAPYGPADDLYTAVAQVAQRSNLNPGIVRLQAEIAKRKPELPEFYLDLGDALQKASRYDEAAAAYRTAIERKPDWASLWARLAMPLRASGKTSEPLDAQLKAVQLAPERADFWSGLGLLQSDLGDKRAAIESLRKSVALDPEEAPTHSALGTALAEVGQLAQAEAELREALKLRPALPGAHGYLGFLLANRGELEDAVWHYERGGDTATNQFNYGIALARLNRLPEARTRWERSLAADPNQPTVHEVLGRLVESQGESAAAIAHYRDAIRLRPEFGLAHYDLGAALARRGDRAGAAAEFRLALADPDPQVRAAANAGLAAVGAQ